MLILIGRGLDLKPEEREKGRRSAEERSRKVRRGSAESEPGSAKIRSSLEMGSEAERGKREGERSIDLCGFQGAEDAAERAQRGLSEEAGRAGRRAEAERSRS